MRISVIYLYYLILRVGCRGVSQNQTFVITIGLISGHCYLQCNNETIIQSNIFNGNGPIYARLLWRHVNTEEAFTVLQTVHEMKQLKLDAMIIAANMSYKTEALDYFPFPIMHWLSHNITSLSKVSHIETASQCQKHFENMQDMETNGDSGNKCQQPSAHFRSISPPPTLYNSNNTLGNIVTSVINYMRWTDTFILAEERSGYSSSSDLVESLSAIGITALVHFLPQKSTPSFKEKILLLLEKARETDYNITLIADTEILRLIFSEPFSFVRKQVQLYPLRHRVKWLVVTTGDMTAEDIGIEKTDMDNVVVIVIPPEVLNKPTMKHDKLQSYVLNVLNDVAKNGQNETEDSLKSAAVNTLLSINQSSISCRWIPISALMITKPRRMFETMGYIQHNGLLLLASRDIFPNIKFQFNGIKFLVATNEWSPFVSKDDKGNYSGFCIDILDHLALDLNFTYEMTKPADGQWGGVDANGSFTGLVGMIQRHQADLVMAPLSIQPERETVMDFSYPFFWEPQKILVRKPDSADTKWRTLIDPFSNTVLICIGISLPFTSFILYMLERFSPYYDSVEDRMSSRGLHHFSDSFWYMYGALLTQGGDHMAESISGRTLLSWWWIFCIIMMSLYSGNLIAFLTVTKDKLPFQTIEEMVSHNDFKWGILGGTAMVYTFSHSKQPYFQKAWERIVEFNQTDPLVLSVNVDHHLQKVLDGNYAYLGDKTFMELKMMNECQLMMADEEFMPLQYAIGLPNNSPYQRLFSDQVMKMHESGLLQVWKQQHWPKRSFCPGSLVTVASTITIIDLQSAFYLIGIGIVLAGFVLAYESISVRVKKKTCDKIHKAF